MTLTPAQLQQRRDAPVKSGARAKYRLEPRARAIADDLRAQVPFAAKCDEASIRLLGVVEAQIEAAVAYLDEHGLIDDHGQARPLCAQLSTWQNTAVRLHNALGLTPASRWKLGLDIARVHDLNLTSPHDLSALTDRELATYRALSKKIETATETEELQP